MKRKQTKKNSKKLLTTAKVVGAITAILVLVTVTVAISVKSTKTSLDNRSDASQGSGVYQVPDLPSDNLIVNPWFSSPLCDPQLTPWVSVPNQDNHQWTASDKSSNPIPPSGCDTAGRISVGRGNDDAGSTVQPNQDIRLHQVVEANPSNKFLTFDMYWVAHTINTLKVTVYGSNSANGPWQEVWVPFEHSIASQLVPPPVENRVVWLWKCYSEHFPECSDAPVLPATTELDQGFAYYKVEFLANLPEETGGFKHTGVYFSASADGTPMPSSTPPSISPPPTPNPTPGGNPRDGKPKPSPRVRFRLPF